jgi:hypothetical protein
MPNQAGETKKLSHEQLMEKYNMYVKNKAKIKREERIKAKNQEIYVIFFKLEF